MVKTYVVRSAARDIVNEHFSSLRSNDFNFNKLVVQRVASMNSKKMCNQITGEVTKLINQLSKGIQVKGINLRMQVMEKQKARDAIPAVSEFLTTPVPKNKAVLAMLSDYGYDRVVSSVFKQQRANPRANFAQAAN
ncbi:MAG: 40S ribosomal protein S17 [Marteilia pararefringens]